VSGLVYMCLILKAGSRGN